MDLLRRLAAGDEASEIRVWRDDPFNPHAIARQRLRAYMKCVAFKYLDHLIAWGDDLFRRDTIELINEATQLYSIANELLGASPVSLPPRETEALSFAVVAEGSPGGRAVGPFSNVWLDLEDGLPADLDQTTPAGGASSAVPLLHPYFCIPPNPRFQEYRDKVADRMFKVRNCMNIEGRTRRLALFEPPIDPALLVRARAAGLDLSTVLREISSTRHRHYRYAYLHQKAAEFGGAVQAFGGRLLSALEKRDAEQLGAFAQSTRSNCLRASPP